MQRNNSNSNGINKKIWETDGFLKEAYSKLNLEYYIGLLNYKGYGSIVFSVLASIFLLYSYNEIILPAVADMKLYVIVIGTAVHLGLLILYPKQFWKKNLIGLGVRVFCTFFYFAALLYGLENWFDYTFSPYLSEDWFLTLLVLGALLIVFKLIFAVSASRLSIFSNAAAVSLLMSSRYLLFGDEAYDMSIETRWVLLVAAFVICNAIGYYILGRINGHEKKREHPAQFP